jgi:hypothetical protein
MRWLNQERLKVYPRIFLALCLLFGLALIVSALASGPHLLDFLGRPLGADFPNIGGLLPGLGQLLFTLMPFPIIWRGWPSPWRGSAGKGILKVGCQMNKFC